MNYHLSCNEKINKKKQKTIDFVRFKQTLLHRFHLVFLQKFRIKLIATSASKLRFKCNRLVRLSNSIKFMLKSDTLKCDYR